MTTPNRIISITWSAVSGSGLLGYNIYLVAGAPENDTKTLLAYIPGLSNTTYNYTGVEGKQYQFEVRSTDGTNESPPLEIFYPNGTSLYTPTTLTPTGNPMMIVRDSQYLTKDEFISYPNGLKLTSSSALYTSGVLDTILQMASEEVNRYCHRHFDVQTIDEVYDGVRINQDAPRLVTVPLNEGPVQRINRVDIQVLKWFINFSLDYLQLFPEKQYLQLVPYLGGNGSAGSPIPSAVLSDGLLAKVWVNYTFGYNVIPAGVKMATSLLATKLIGLQQNPVGAKSMTLGQLSLSWGDANDPLTQKAYQLLEPYRVSTFRRP